MASAGARAAPPRTRPTRLDYARAPGADACPDAQRLRDAIAVRLGYDPFSDEASQALSCRVDADDRGLRAEITMRTADGAVVGIRSLQSGDRSCRDLAPALLLVLSVAAGAPDAAPVGAAEPPSPTAAPVAGALIAPAAPSPVASSPIAIRVGAGLFATEHSLPGASAGAAASIGLAGVRTALSLEAAAEAPRDLALAGGQATVWRASAALVLCRSRGLWLGCALAAAGILHGAGRGIPQARAVTGPWAGVGARLGARFPLSPALALEAHADVVVPVVRTRLLVGPDAIWTTPVVSGALGVALTRTFR